MLVVIHINMSANSNPMFNIHINRMPMGCHWDATGVQRRVPSNMNMNMNTNANPTNSIHINEMPLKCHWDAEV